MAKNKYYTEYPKQLKKEAHKLGVKIRKSDLKFLDQLLLNIEQDNIFRTEAAIDPQSEDIELHFRMAGGTDIYMQIDPYNNDSVGFTTHVEKISQEVAEIVGKMILEGRFIDNYLAQQITLEPEGDYGFEIVMKGQPWIDRKSKHAVDACCLFILCLLEQRNQIARLLRNEVNFPTYDLRITSYGESKIKVIKAIREFTGLGLRESKEIAEGSPEALIHANSAEEFVCIQRILKEAGATSEIA